MRRILIFIFSLFFCFSSVEFDLDAQKVRPKTVKESKKQSKKKWKKSKSDAKKSKAKKKKSKKSLKKKKRKRKKGKSGYNYKSWRKEKEANKIPDVWLESEAIVFIMQHLNFQARNEGRKKDGRWSWGNPHYYRKYYRPQKLYKQALQLREVCREMKDEFLYLTENQCVIHLLTITQKESKIRYDRVNRKTNDYGAFQIHCERGHTFCSHNGRPPKKKLRKLFDFKYSAKTYAKIAVLRQKICSESVEGDGFYERCKSNEYYLGVPGSVGQPWNNAKYLKKAIEAIEIYRTNHPLKNPYLDEGELIM